MSVAAQRLRELFSLGGVTELAEAVPVPLLVLDAAARVHCANAAARARLDVGGSEAGESGALRELRAHHRAWAEGAPLRPVFVSASRAGAASSQLVVPFPVLGEPGAVACLLFDAGSAESRAPRWFVPEAAEAEARRDASAIGELDARRRDDASLARLTTREWEIARRIAAGDRVSLLAEDLRISPNTVRNHLKAIFRKLGVNSQSQLVRTVRSLSGARAAPGA
jgi:DNA-binding CsgD family transcriptional regulator